MLEAKALQDGRKTNAVSRAAVFLACVMVGGMIAPSAASAAETRYRIESSHSYAEFAVLHLGLATARGKFTQVTGTIALDSGAGTGHVEVSLAADSVATGDATLDRVLRGIEFFNAEEFPALSFVGEKFEFAQGKLQRVEGQLTLLGVTKPVVLVVERMGCSKNLYTRFRAMCGADATATLRRSDFGMTRYASAIGDEVKINIAVEAVVEGDADTTR